MSARYVVPPIIRRAVDENTYADDPAWFPFSLRLAGCVVSLGRDVIMWAWHGGDW